VGNETVCRLDVSLNAPFPIVSRLAGNATDVMDEPRKAFPLIVSTPGGRVNAPVQPVLLETTVSDVLGEVLFGK